MNKKTSIVFIFFGMACIAGLFLCSNIHAKNLTAGIVLSDDQGKILYSQNEQKLFVPASILKILTSLATLHTLGPDFHFSTHYSFDPESKNLYIKGFGDPLLISEVIEKLCRNIISTTKPRQIHDIVLDQTYFSDKIQVPGKGNSVNPYDAPIGALCANFNTITFKWNNQTNRFISGEPQTPLLPAFLGDIKKTRLKKGRIVLSKQQSLLYPGRLVKFFLEKNHVNVTGSVQRGKFMAGQGVKNIFFSPFDITQVVQRLLKFSNNYTANLLLLTLGAETFGPPSTLSKGVRAIQEFSKQHLKFDDLIIFEGSGLSRSNLISPDQMIKVLLEFLPYYRLLNQKEKDFFKTGTLSDVRTRAGYISGENGRLYPYVIMVNQTNKGYDAILKKLIQLTGSGLPF
jgi:D-alanyl-D-alanine carboxypeptidase/D-alanyl-D-alanine-endopeptidase (penicillin-binding protein 4)